MFSISTVYNFKNRVKCSSFTRGKTQTKNTNIYWVMSKKILK